MEEILKNIDEAVAEGKRMAAANAECEDNKRMMTASEADVVWDELNELYRAIKDGELEDRDRLLEEVRFVLLSVDGLRECVSAARGVIGI